MARHSNLDMIDISSDTIKLGNYVFKLIQVSDRKKVYKAEGEYITKRNIPACMNLVIRRNSVGILFLIVDFSETTPAKQKDFKPRIYFIFRNKDGFDSVEDNAGYVLLYGNTLKRIC